MLMVEDDDNDVFFFERALKQAEITHPFYRVRNGEEAIAYLRGEGPYRDRAQFPQPRFLLLDLKMPRKNGFEVIEWVRQQPGLRRLPIVVFSSSREYPDVNRAYELGANTYLVKPVKFEELVEMVKALHAFWLGFAEQPTISVQPRIQ
jgi:CheY-like chemotaxis protein